MRARVAPVRNEAAQPIAYVMTVRDITDVVARERELARVEQLARLGELAAGLAHEIKNPLAGIQGAMDILLSRRDAQNPERQVLEGVKREVERINQTVHLLLDRARPRALQLQPVSLNEIVQRAINLARASVPAARRAQIKLHFQPRTDELVLPLDAAQIEDAVLNLLLNAVDAIDGQGTVTVELRRDTAPEAVIEVTDTGRGINDGQRVIRRLASEADHARSSDIQERPQTGHILLGRDSRVRSNRDGFRGGDSSRQIDSVPCLSAGGIRLPGRG